MSSRASNANPEEVSDKRAAGIGLQVAVKRHKHGVVPESKIPTEPAEKASALERMRQKHRSPAGRALHKMRKANVAVLRFCLLDSKAVIFASHKFHSHLLAHHRG